jgi:site-specific DNA-adenine methylase
MSHFPIAYAGNKRREFKFLERYALDSCSTVIEPYCGTSAFSFLLAKKYPAKFKFVLNDIDSNLIELYKILKNETRRKEFQTKVNDMVAGIIDKETYKNLPDGLEKWFIHRKYYNRHVSLFPSTKALPWKPIELDKAPIVKFLENENIELSNIDGCKLIDENKDKDGVFMFVDPPYIEGCNNFYSENSGLNVFEYLYENKINNFTAIKILIMFFL